MSTSTAKRVQPVHAVVQKSRAENAKQLETLLHEFPKVNPDVIPAAVAELMDIANRYKASRPIVDDQGHRRNPLTAEARDAMKKLVKHLTAVQSAISALPLNAMVELSNASGAPWCKSKAVLAQLCDAAIAAQNSLAQKPDKQADTARYVLAIEVAVLFRDMLNLKPSSTSDRSPYINKRRGGAAYARVLRTTLAVAGISNVDVGPLITAGLKGLTDPNMPHNL